MLKNEISLPGINNARELGGYKAGDKVIKHGLLIRTGALKDAAPEAVELLKNKYNLKAIVDFRMQSERINIPDPEVEGAKYYGFSVVEMEDYFARAKDVREVDKQLLWKTNDRMALFEQAYEYGMLGPETYVSFLMEDRGKKAYKEFFKVLLDVEENGAVLWHCTDGKDRTGLAAMLILIALGADKDTVMEDYMLTNVYNSQTLEYVKSRLAGSDMPQRKRDALMFMLGGVVERYMTGAIEALINSYGSVKEYMFEELSVGDPELKVLRRKFLV